MPYKLNVNNEVVMTEKWHEGVENNESFLTGRKPNR